MNARLKEKSHMTTTHTFTIDDLTRLLVITLGQLERMNAAARVAAAQTQQAWAMARTLQEQRDQAEAQLAEVTSDDTREALAAYAHEAWNGWMRYLFRQGTTHGDGSFTIRPWAVERWVRQMQTTYADLPEDEKQSDRAEADQILKIIRGATP
jgi:hypothetical protein